MIWKVLKIVVSFHRGIYFYSKYKLDERKRIPYGGSDFSQISPVPYPSTSSSFPLVSSNNGQIMPLRPR